MTWSRNVRIFARKFRLNACGHILEPKIMAELLKKNLILWMDSVISSEFRNFQTNQPCNYLEIANERKHFAWHYEILEFTVFIIVAKKRLKFRSYFQFIVRFSKMRKAKELLAKILQKSRHISENMTFSRLQWHITHFLPQSMLEGKTYVKKKFLIVAKIEHIKNAQQLAIFLANSKNCDVQNSTVTRFDEVTFRFYQDDKCHSKVKPLTMSRVAIADF